MKKKRETIFLHWKINRNPCAELRFVPQIDNSVYYIEQGSIYVIPFRVRIYY